MQAIFKRMEMKYMLTAEQYSELRKRLAGFMEEDKYGLHTICSIYFDNDEDQIIRTSMEKPLYKEKLRLRSYGVPKSGDSTVFLELKKKYKGVVYKRRIPLKLSEAEEYISCGKKPEDSQIFREIDYFRNHYSAYPKIFVGYDRIAMKGIYDENIRVTFDFNVRCRREEPDLRKGDHGFVLIPEGTALMEIKINGAMDKKLAGILSELKIYPSSFSKYGEFYKRELKGENLSCSPIS